MPDTTEYLTRRDLLQRYKFSSATFHRLRHNPDSDIRFPTPALIMGQTPLWLIADVDAYDERQRELSKDRTTRGPIITDSASTISRRSRARQKAASSPRRQL